MNEMLKQKYMSTLNS